VRTTSEGKKRREKEAGHDDCMLTQLHGWGDAVLWPAVIVSPAVPRWRKKRMVGSCVSRALSLACSGYEIWEGTVVGMCSANPPISRSPKASSRRAVVSSSPWSFMMTPAMAKSSIGLFPRHSAAGFFRTPLFAEPVTSVFSSPSISQSPIPHGLCVGKQAARKTTTRKELPFPTS
jgi:hypothetical protein